MKKSAFAVRNFPARIAHLGFSLSLPRDWIEHALAQEAPDFDDPGSLVALAVVTAPHAAIVLAVAARPAYAEGTVSDWGRWLLERESASLRAMGEGKLGALPALIAEATKDSEMGALVLRTAFAEDGARLINVTLTAPEMLADAVFPVWRAVLESFTLETPRGATRPVYAPVQPSDIEAPVEEPARETPSAPIAEKPSKERRRERKQRRRKLIESPPGPPAWWTAAEKLEAEGRTEQAVAHVQSECNMQGALLSQAELWARTMRRLLEAGDRALAREAWEKSRNLAHAYAASATSGGEGAALSRERDAFLAQLGPEPALDP